MESKAMRWMGALTDINTDDCMDGCAHVWTERHKDCLSWAHQLKKEL